MISIIAHEWVFSRRRGDDNLVKRLLGSLSGVMAQVSCGFHGLSKTNAVGMYMLYRHIGMCVLCMHAWLLVWQLLECSETRGV